MLKNMGPFLVLFLLIACGEKTSIHYGKTTKKALIEIKGEPLKTEEVPSGEVLTYENNEKFQVSEDKVTNSFRDPAADEKNVLFWRHSFRDCDTKERELNEENVPEVELSCPSMGRSIIFLKGTGKVLRVGEK
jgi:transketolase